MSDPVNLDSFICFLHCCTTSCFSVYMTWHCLPSFLPVQYRDFCSRSFVTFTSLTFAGTCLGCDFFSCFKMPFGWESVIESGPNMSWLSQSSWGAGLVSMQVSLVLCVGVSDKPALPATGQHLCLCSLIVTSMASCQCSDFLYLPLPRQWGYCCRTFTFTASNKCLYLDWLRKML